MARRGRPRKDATALLPPGREPNGRTQRLTTVQQMELAAEAKRQREMSVVLSQPHRRGNTSQLSESVLGRFCQQNRLRRELYDSGLEFGAMVRRYDKYWDAPMADRIQGSGSGLPDDADKDRWKAFIEKAEKAIVDAHGDLSAIRAMCVDEKPPSRWTGRSYIIKGLFALAVEIGRLGIRDKPRE